MGTTAGLVERYRRSGFGGRVRRGRRPSVLVVDFALGFTDPAYPTGSDMSAAVEATAAVLDTAREVAAPVLFTTIGYGDADEAGAWLAKAPGLAELRVGSQPVELDGRLRRRAGEPLLVKKGPSAFAGTELHAMLTDRAVDTLIVCGATTSGCVRASVVDALTLGYPVLVPADCVADRAREPHEANLFDMDQKYADVVDGADVRGYLAACAR